MNVPYLDTLIKVIGNLSGLLIKLGLAISVIVLIYSGYKYFSTPGETKKIHINLLFIIIGILIILLVFDIPKLLKELLQ